MNRTQSKTLAVIGLSAVTLFGGIACAKDSSTNASAAPETSTSASMTPMTSPAATSAMADPAAGLVGNGCAAYAQQVPSGPGSVTGMAQDPVAVAASNNPHAHDADLGVVGQAQSERQPGRHAEQ